MMLNLKLNIYESFRDLKFQELCSVQFYYSVFSHALKLLLQSFYLYEEFEIKIDEISIIWWDFRDIARNLWKIGLGQ